MLAVRRALEEGAGATRPAEIGFLGLGSISIATLHSAPSLRAPARLSLCDVYSKRERAEAIRRELVEELGYGKGEVRVSPRASNPGVHALPT